MYNIEHLNPARLGIVLMDLQRGYCDPASDCAVKLGWDVGAADAICKAHVPFLESARKILSPKQFIWFQMEEHPHSLPPNLRGSGSFLNEEEALCVRGTEGYDFHIVAPAAGEAVFPKFHPNGFHSAAFRDYLAQHGITQLAFTGVIGSRCVNATIISAAERDFECIALTDLIGGPARFHAEIETHLKVTTHLYALPLRGEELVLALSKAEEKAA